MKMQRLKKFVPITVVVLLAIVVWSSGLGKHINFETLKEYRRQLKDFVAMYPMAAPAIYMLVYAVSIALSVPWASFLSLTGGFLFLQPFSTLYTVTAATIGACGIFLAAKTAFGEMLQKRAGPLLKKLEAGFQENAISYLFFLRLVPLFPFWLVNLAPALVGVSLRVFFWTTFLGIIPGAFVYTQAGAGLGAIFDTEGSFSIDAVFNTQIKIALAALGIFALIPVVIKKFRKK